MALEELNSEYIALKRGQGSKDDLSAVLVSLRTRYNDLRTKVGAQSAVAYGVNVFILLGNFILIKPLIKSLRSHPLFEPFMIEFRKYFESNQIRITKKCAPVFSLLQEFSFFYLPTFSVKLLFRIICFMSYFFLFLSFVTCCK